MSLKRAAQFRYHARHPWQTLLALLGIALGVAIVAGIDLSLDSAQRAFKLSVEAVAGKASHRILAGSGFLDEKLYLDLRLRHGFRDIAPVVEGTLESDGQTLRLLGIDPFAQEGQRTRYEPATNQSPTRLLAEPDTALIGKRSAQKLGAQPGGRLAVKLAGQDRSIAIIGYLEGDDPPTAALEGLLVADIATTQEILGRTGLLDRIDVRLADRPEELERLRASLPPGAVLEATDNRDAATLRMTDAFSLNLKALSLLALLVGMFIIYNAMSFSVLQRRPVLATLRVLGVTRGEILVGILGEALLLGALGAGLGLGLGILAARGLLHMVTRTMGDLYFVTTVTELFLSPWLLAKGLLLGIAATLVASLVPALEAAWSPPSLAQRRSVLEERFHRLPKLLAGLGLLLLVLAYVLLNRAGEGLGPALMGQFCQMLGYALLTPAALTGLLAAARRLPAPPLVRLALNTLRGSLSRTGVAMAALTLSVAAGIGVGVMVHSFRGAVEGWLERILEADIYVSLPSGPGRSSTALPPELVSALRQLPGVERTGTGRKLSIETGLGRSEFMVIDPAYADRPAYRFQGNDGAAIWREFQARDLALISESYANRHHLKPGDTLSIATAEGFRPFPIGGIVFDYRSDQGIVILHRRVYDRIWHDPGISSLSLFLKPDADLGAVQAAAERLAATRHEAILVRSNREIREHSMEIFDRTFLVTRVLRALSLAVAFVGILGALLAWQIERAKELAVLRATGLTPRQAVALALLQCGFLGLAAGLLAWPLGLGVAAALVKVINLRSFGWTMDLAWPIGIYLEALALSTIAALLAGLYPAWRAGRVPPALALRED